MIKIPPFRGYFDGWPAIFVHQKNGPMILDRANCTEWGDYCIVPREQWGID